MKTLYLAKEPDAGVRDDLSRISGEVVVVDCLDGYIDWYKLKGYDCISTSEFFSLTDMKFSMVIGNPPYGNAGKLAVRFLNKSMELSDDVRMVLPRSIRKPSALNRINLDFHCVNDVDVDDSAFAATIDAVVQNWEKKPYKREKIEVFSKHEDFEFVTPEAADCMIGRVGNGPTGRVKTEDFMGYKRDHYYLKVKSETVLNNLISIQDELRLIASQSNGMMSLSKHELILTYSNHFGQ